MTKVKCVHIATYKCVTHTHTCLTHKHTCALNTRVTQTRVQHTSQTHTPMQWTHALSAHGCRVCAWFDCLTNSATRGSQYSKSVRHSAPVNLIRCDWFLQASRGTFFCFGMHTPKFANMSFSNWASFSVRSIGTMATLNSNFVKLSSRCRQHTINLIGSIGSNGGRCQVLPACVRTYSAMSLGWRSPATHATVSNLAPQPGHSNGSVEFGGNRWHWWYITANNILDIRYGFWTFMVSIRHPLKKALLVAGLWMSNGHSNGSRFQTGFTFCGCLMDCSITTFCEFHFSRLS